MTFEPGKLLAVLNWARVDIAGSQCLSEDTAALSSNFPVVGSN